ncbi:MAG: SRPBCC family protein, partial [Gammaproteobacteria bacterium]|nr:SRPBCC family protein [Gammaproteobacteria bacterium]
MKVLGKILKYILILIVVLAIAAYALPRQRHVDRSINIDASAENILPYLTNLKTFNEWSPWAPIDPEGTTYAYSGPESGVGASVKWASDNPEVGSGKQTITSVSQSKVTSDLDFGPQGTAQAYFMLAPAAQGTNVTWGFDTDMGGNPIGRWMGLFMDKWVGGSYEQGLNNLKTLVEKNMQTNTAQKIQTDIQAPAAAKKPKELS